jgi:hypothetical protein
VTDRDLTHRLDTLARALRDLSRSMTRSRRSVTTDAPQLVDVEGVVDAAVRSLRSFQRAIQETPSWVPSTGGR